MTTLSSLSKTKRQENVRTVGQQFQSIVIIISITAFLFGGIVWRLAYLQLKQGEINQAKAEDNRIRLVPKPPVRANIFDRKGKVLATTRLSHGAYVWPKAQKQANWTQIKQILAQILNLPPEEIQQKVEQAGFDYPSLIPIARSLTPTQITAIEEYRPELKWIEVDIDRVRYYPNGKTAAHVLGYTGEINQEELKAKKKDGYRLGDVIGKMGVEESFESKLRGAWGGLKLEVDGSGRVLRFLGEQPPKSGQDITLTIDLEVQKAAEAALGQQKGAIIALNPNNGAVIAIASYPSFDPNVFSTRITPEIWQQLQSQGNPFLNMALRGFPPASTFKVVTDTAGMESGKFPPQTVLGTYAGINIGGTYFREWNHAGFGSMGYVGALSWSSNTFHAQIGRGVGGETLIKWARNYGYGQKTGIELQGETSGLIADDAWKRRNFDNWGWTVGDTVNMSIGQGFTLATPVQVAVMFSAIANGGYRVKPHLLETDNQIKQAERVNLNLKPSTISTLRNGLRGVVTSGTGTRLNVPEIPSAAGKSGTAEAPPGKSHAWFGAYAPFDQPEIVVVAFAEHSGGGGGSVAGPMVRQVMEVYFNHKVTNK
jgi:penicillin-binding protein 2